MLLKKIMKAEAMSISRMSPDYEKNPSGTDYGDYSGGRTAGPRDFPWYLFLSVLRQFPLISFSYSDPTWTTFLGLPEALYVMICHYRPATFLFSSSPISQCHQTVAPNCYKTINVIFIGPRLTWGPIFGSGCPSVSP